MDAILKSQAEQLANELAAQVTTLEDLNGLMRTMMKTALERMLNTEMDVHLQRRGTTELTNDAPAAGSPATAINRSPMRPAQLTSGLENSATSFTRSAWRERPVFR